MVLGPEAVPQVPGGGLLAHETAPQHEAGHTIERHVGRTNQQLLDRANPPSGGGPSAASSFDILADAERFIAGAIAADPDAVDEYLAGEGEGNLRLRHCFPDEVTGRTVARGSQQVTPASCVLVVLRRDDARDPGYIVLTAYPVAP